MSGVVHVKGDASQSAGATGRGGLLVHRRQRLGALRHLDEGHRHRREGLDRAHERLHGAGRQSGRARRRRRCARRFDLRGAALRARRGEEPRRRLHREGDARRAQRDACTRCSAAPAWTARSTSATSGATARRASSTISTSTTPEPIDGLERPRTTAAPFGDVRSTHRSSEIRRAAATGIYDIRGGGAKRQLPHFDDLLFLGASISRYPLEGYRENCGTDVVLGTRFAEEADRPRRSRSPSPA